jgi:hypothetical protein
MHARQPEQTLAISIDMVGVQEAVATPGHGRPQPQLPLNQRQAPHVFAVAP